ncbi:MAG: site-specific integrase, partial [Lachnospiraceae bacterium]|nr:site-specific integrase [Lachnospiraceae bacterium]
EALTRDQERKFLKFVKEDEHFSKYYEGIYILFKTGMRISEFSGLTVSDIDFRHHTINIDHQLMKRGSHGYYIETTKTEAGTRVIPMTPDVEECFRKIIKNRKAPKKEPMIEGKVGFLYFDKNGSVMYSLHWENYFKHIRQKYNSIYKVQMPLVTPHVCRHTYCSNMANSGMNPKTLQYLMGHSDISVTLNTYAHVNLDDAKNEVDRVMKIV